MYSKGWDEHLLHMKVVLDMLRENQLKVNKKKCSFGKSSIDYLGHVISEAGVVMDLDKISAILRWPILKSIKAVRRFLELTGYYRQFIEGYKKIARPLMNLLRKESQAKFHWIEESKLAFNRLKKVIVSSTVLAMPNFSLPFVLECNASGSGIGAI